MATKKVENKQKVFYAVNNNTNPDTSGNELYAYKTIEEAIAEGGWDFANKVYAYKIELLGEVKQTIKIV